MAEAYNPNPEGEVTIIGLAKELVRIFNAKKAAFLESWRDDTRETRGTPRRKALEIQKGVQVGEVLDQKLSGYHSLGIKHPQTLREGMSPTFVSNNIGIDARVEAEMRDHPELTLEEAKAFVNAEDQNRRIVV